MKKTYILISLILLLIACKQNSKSGKNYLAELKRENDSLKRIIDTLNTKFIFDNASLSSVPMLWKKNRDGEITAYIAYVAYNKTDKILISGDSKFLNSDTLTFKKNYEFTFNKSKVDTVYYKLINKTKFGKNIDYTVSDPMINYR